MIVVTIIVFLLILGLLIFVHELGHYATARFFGVKVEEFGIGYPPRIYARKRGETEYSLNWIPLGGFCKLLGEEDPSSPRSLASKKPLVRLVVLGAGSFMNAVLPIILLTIAFMVPRQVNVEDILIEGIAPDSPAMEAGIEPRDTILSMNGNAVENRGDVFYYTHLSFGEETTLELLKPDGTIETVTLIPRWDPPEGEGAMGINLYPEPVNLRTISESDPFWEAVPKSATTLWQTFELIRNEVKSWFVQKEAPEVGGPVAIFQLTGEANEAGPSYLLQFAAFLSLNLAIINLFPLPALDGGRIVFVLIEIVRRGKRVSPRTEAMVHLVGFMMLMGLIVVITYYDILRAIRGESLVP
ncbi:MAG TPA: site-2 protease family protein [Dehalococcoidia bacterium]|nr:site-2 protease family protein [Dehalococcoidia bacterium]